MPFKKPEHPQNVEKVTFKKPPVLPQPQIIHQLLKLNHLMTCRRTRAAQHNNTREFSENDYTPGKVMQKHRRAPLKLKTLKWLCSRMVNMSVCVCVCVCVCVGPCEIVLLPDWHSPYTEPRPLTYIKLYVQRCLIHCKYSSRLHTGEKRYRDGLDFILRHVLCWTADLCFSVSHLGAAPPPTLTDRIKKTSTLCAAPPELARAVAVSFIPFVVPMTM